MASSAENSGGRWRDWLGLNASTLALLGAILLVTASTELWSPLVPQYLKSLQRAALGGDPWLIVLIGLYGFYRDGLEALNYYAGGAIAARFNTRRALLAFNLLPLVGLAILFIWQSRTAVFLAIPFVFVWDSLAGPAIVTVVGDALPSDRRTMAFTLQSIFRRVSRMVAYGVGGLFLWQLGSVTGGVRANVAAAAALVLAALVIQFRSMGVASRDEQLALARPREVLRQFNPDLRRLLISDIFARWAEGMAKPFIILFCVPILAAEAARGAAVYQSVLLNIEAAMNVLLYLLIAPRASRAGLAKKPFIGLTFVFFSAFPIALGVLGATLGAAGLYVAFAVAGCRELGEPARKAMIADLVAATMKTQSVGAYWSARGVAVMPAALVGAGLWLVGERVTPGWGALWTFTTAGLLGAIGAVVFYSRFGRSA